MLHLNIALCDEDINFLNILESHINTYMFNRDVDFKISSFNNPSVLIKSSLNTYYNLVILEMEMSNSNGIDLVKTLEPHLPNTFYIYVSKNIELIKESFEVHPFYFLTKPLTYSSIEHVLDDLILTINESNKLIAIISHDNIEEIINLDEVYYIDVQDSKKELLNFHLGKRIVTAHGKINSILKKLPHSNFYKCYRNIIVNTVKIKRFNSNSINLSNNETIPLGTAKKELLKQLTLRGGVYLSR